MALDVCIETYGSVAPAISHDSIVSLLRVGMLGSRSSTQTHRQPVDNRQTVETWYEAVFRVADRLPFALVQALWLVEICRCSYEEAATELSTTPDVISRRVAAAYRAIRVEVSIEPPGPETADKPPD